MRQDGRNAMLLSPRGSRNCLEASVSEIHNPNAKSNCTEASRQKICCHKDVVVRHTFQLVYLKRRVVVKLTFCVVVEASARSLICAVSFNNAKGKKGVYITLKSQLPPKNAKEWNEPRKQKAIYKQSRESNLHKKNIFQGEKNKRRVRSNMIYNEN